MNGNKSSIIVEPIENGVQIRVEHYIDKDCRKCFHFMNYDSKCDFLAGVCQPNEYVEVR
jgi:hypothetical protein